MRYAPLLLALLLPCLPATAQMEMETGDSLQRLPDAQWTVDAAAHLLRRAGFGGSIEDARALHALGLDAAVDALLNWEGQPDPDVPSPHITVTARPGREAFMAATSEDARRELRQRYRRSDYAQMAAVREWWMQVMLRTQHPLRERLTLMWHGHFTSSHRDVRNSYHMYLQNTLLRRHAAGNFRELLHAISKDPAMLEYLDNRQNRKGHPNENYAREVMELFTLGVGNYSEKDIKEAARALTGWTFAGNRFVDNRGQHDDGPKTIFGRTAKFDGDQLLDLLLEQKAASRHIATRLFRYFAHDYPNDAVIDGLAKTLRDAEWELKPALRQLFRSQAFYGDYAQGTQIKSPVVLLVGLVRSLGMNPEILVGASALAAQLGQNLMDPPNVKGWPGGREWINTSILFERYNLCATIVGAPGDKRDGMLNRKNTGQMQRIRRIMEMRMDPESDDAMAPRRARGRRFTPPPTFNVLKPVREAQLKTPAEIVDHFCATLYAVPVGSDVKSTLLAYLEQDGGYPTTERAQRTRLHGMLRLLVSTPEFQLN